MLWYEGAIPDAIAKAKKERKLFLVYIEGDDELSQQMTSTYNNADVTEKLTNCVAIKLAAKSESCQQFSQIYPVVVIPSSFFIGADGIPLEIIAGSLEPAQFVTRIVKTLKLHAEKCDNDKQESKKKEDSHSSSSSSSVTEAHVEAAEPAPTEHGQKEPVPPSNTTESPDVKQYEHQRTSEPTDTSEENAPTSAPVDNKMTNEMAEEILAESQEDTSHLTLEQKVERAKELLELRRIQKEKEEQEKEKEAELERRRTMKELQKARQQQQENDLREWAQSRAKEKEEERLARERVRAQIAQDRAERAAKYQKEKAEELSRQQKALEERLKREQEQAAIAAAQKSQHARIQFRMPDGSSVNHQFSADATLQDLHNYLVQEIRPPFTSFTLSTTFPRRQFQSSDYQETLRELQLAPSAAILVVPDRRISTPSHQPGNTWNFLWLLLAPLAMVWSFFSSLIFGNPTQQQQPPESRSSERPKRKQDRDAQGAAANGSGSSGSESEQGTSRKRRNGEDADSSFYRREGNIYRLSTHRNDDDDNNTWNGNSTQQM